MSEVKPMIAGKRKINKSLKAWITFVKKVQKEEKLSYKDAIHRAKVRKDKGEKWMTGGQGTTGEMTITTAGDEFQTVPLTTTPGEEGDLLGVVGEQMANPSNGGKRRRRTMRRTRGGRRSRASRRARGRASRRH